MPPSGWMNTLYGMFNEEYETSQTAQTGAAGQLQTTQELLNAGLINSQQAQNLLVNHQTYATLQQDMAALQRYNPIQTQINQATSDALINGISQIQVDSSRRIRSVPSVYSRAEQAMLNNAGQIISVPELQSSGHDYRYYYDSPQIQANKSTKVNRTEYINKLITQYAKPIFDKFNIKFENKHITEIYNVIPNRYFDEPHTVKDHIEHYSKYILQLLMHDEPKLFLPTKGLCKHKWKEESKKKYSCYKCLLNHKIESIL